MVDLGLIAHRTRVASEMGPSEDAARAAVSIAPLAAVPAALGPEAAAVSPRS
jgi:hypothetical protein